MKKLLLVLLPLVFVSLLLAHHLTPADLKSDLSIEYGGDFVTRAIMNNDANENNGGWFDNRLRFDLQAKLGDKFSIAWKPEIGYYVFSGFGNNSGFETRELYMDYSMDYMETTIRMGRQYWSDHRSLVLDDYFAGFTADMHCMGLDTELGFIKADEGATWKYNDVQAAFAAVMSEAPINWGLTAMWGQDHAANTADIWLMPYAGVKAGPANIDLNVVIDQQMFKDIDSEMGMGFAVKAGVDMGFKVGADFLFVTDKGLNSYSSYYENGLYLFGNKLPYDGVQLVYNPYGPGGDQAFMSFVVNGSFPLNDKMEIFGAAGMLTKDDPIGTEVNVGVNFKCAENLTFNPVLAIGNTGKHFDHDPITGDETTNMVYMLGGILTAEF